MWFVIASAVIAAAGSYRSASGQYAAMLGLPDPQEPDRDWRDMERERMAELRRETAATHRRAILGALLFVALAAAIAYAVYQTIWGPA